MNKYKQSLNYIKDAFIPNLQELVDKEEPNKPHLEGDGYWNGEMVYDIWICPNCGKEYEIDYDGKYNYCPQCGQHIDWSDYE